MKDQNQRQRHHIRAARDWLGKAEHSLAEDNEVRGELKVMLAKAELAQARQGAEAGPLRRWGRRLLPAAAAFLIAGGGWLGLQLVQPGRPPALAVENAPSTPETPAAALPPAAEDSPTAAADDAPTAAADDAVSSEPVSQPPVYASSEAAAHQPAAPVPGPAALPAAQEQQAPGKAPSKAPAVPNDNMQKLMQTAGKALRQ